MSVLLWLHSRLAHVFRPTINVGLDATYSQGATPHHENPDSLQSLIHFSTSLANLNLMLRRNSLTAPKAPMDVQHTADSAREAALG